MTLEEIRQEIDQVDDALVALLEQRMNLVGQVVAFKQSNGKAVADPKREERIFLELRARLKIRTIKKRFLRPLRTS